MSQKKSKQSARKNPVFRAKESMSQKKSKQSARNDPVFKAKERDYQKESKQSARKDYVCEAQGFTTFSCDLVLENSVIMWSR